MYIWIPKKETRAWKNVQPHSIQTEEGALIDVLRIKWLWTEIALMHALVRSHSKWTKARYHLISSKEYACRNVQQETSKMETNVHYNTCVILGHRIHLIIPVTQNALPEKYRILQRRAFLLIHLTFGLGLCQLFYSLFPSFSCLRWFVALKEALNWIAAWVHQKAVQRYAWWINIIHLKVSLQNFIVRNNIFILNA